MTDAQKTKPGARRAVRNVRCHNCGERIYSHDGFHVMLEENRMPTPPILVSVNGCDSVVCDKACLVAAVQRMDGEVLAGSTFPLSIGGP